jgi:membrane peptidoglycan carboxypeptidase
MKYKRRIFVVLSILGFFACLALGARYLLGAISDYRLPKGKLNFGELKPHSAQAVQDVAGRVLFYRYGPNLVIYRPLSEISKHLQEYVVMLEDDKFFTHNGFDVEQIKNSLEENMERGKIKRGASTITQQLAKNMFLDKERSWTRKLFEIPWTMRLERDLTKKQILDLYFNVIEWGPGVHGAEAAARHYFDKTAAELDPGNAMYLAVIVPNPIRFDLFAHPGMEKFLNEKKHWLVERLVNEHKIDPSEKEAYLDMPFGLVPPDAPGRRFAVSHEGSYYGNRYRRSEVWDLVEKKLPKRALRGSSVTLTLDKIIMERLFNTPTLSSDATSDRYFVITQGGRIRAFRPLKAGESIDSAQLTDIFDLGYEFQELETLDWNSLVI